MYIFLRIFSFSWIQVRCKERTNERDREEITTNTVKNITIYREKKKRRIMIPFLFLFFTFTNNDKYNNNRKRIINKKKQLVRCV